MIMLQCAITVCSGSTTERKSPFFRRGFLFYERITFLFHPASAKPWLPRCSALSAGEEVPEREEPAVWEAEEQGAAAGIPEQA